MADFALSNDGVRRRVLFDLDPLVASIQKATQAIDNRERALAATPQWRFWKRAMLRAEIRGATTQQNTIYGGLRLTVERQGTTVRLEGICETIPECVSEERE